MRVKVRLKGFPELFPPFAGEEQVPVNFPGNSVHDLIHHLMSKIGGKTKGVLLNEEDCFGNTFPTCGGCLWAQGVIRCP